MHIAHSPSRGVKHIPCDPVPERDLGSVIMCTDPDPSFNKQKIKTLISTVSTVCNPVYGFKDPDPSRIVTDPEHCLASRGQIHKALERETELLVFRSYG
jgi:hypothetical protein